MQAFHGILMKKILITGASGFIGSFIVEEALRRNMEVWAAVRPTSSRRYLRDSHIRFIELDFSSEQTLREQLAPHQFDYIVHVAGATKCLRKSDFFRINTDGTKNLVRALLSLKMPIERFVYLSSLSVFGAVSEEQPYRDISENDERHPNTAYGESKKEAEDFLFSLSGFPCVILRPTGVYGPREKDYFLMVKSIKQHTDFAVGFRRQDITFVYVRDVVQAVFLSLERGKSGRAYFLSDGNVYRSAAFSNLIREELGNPWWIRITAPIGFLRVITWLGDWMGRLTGKLSPLNNDKYQIMKQRNWRCDIRPAISELGYQPEYDLARGVKETVNWYKENKWI